MGTMNIENMIAILSAEASKSSFEVPIYFYIIVIGIAIVFFFIAFAQKLAHDAKIRESEEKDYKG